jgi:hypothetical protein
MTTFNNVEARINAAAMRHLCNATAVIGGAAGVDVIFDAAYGTELDIAGVTPAIKVPTTACALVDEGVTTVVVNATNYIATRHQPDGVGISVLRLREV